ncbi:hypothetical protein ACO2J1_04830 [Leptospira interrogans]|uniref:Uncharacterized protein n=16 Tax=Leptospira interrogans TaxID=173 RepID=A0A1B9FN55_LEPIR|nr:MULTISPECIES: hypothetical protein [Leptospira]APH40121.1 Uncharacterized protein A9P81_0141 [Leptospira interrogans serovar Copenhageni/Icterohaemorrhagiae]EMF41910.1 hypothetical protein LEP1GSC067_1404 [Leptospira interrogans serovar Lora str. TE 1992]EMG09435.1 hypothetical protein LEP1GSC151_4430 [Leptospira interrogans serovar Grippotyphosa str. LT2186]EMG23549.1 hypothetical protein LEP1GSC150_4919 [Leptospira interrogans serovar Copenhageni str. LT2050]EMM83380.1 hypothetical protei
MILSQFNVDPAENKIIFRIIVEITTRCYIAGFGNQRDQKFSNRMIIKLKIILNSYLIYYFLRGQKHFDSNSSF